MVLQLKRRCSGYTRSRCCRVWLVLKFKRIESVLKIVEVVVGELAWYSNLRDLVPVIMNGIVCLVLQLIRCFSIEEGGDDC